MNIFRSDFVHSLGPEARHHRSHLRHALGFLAVTSAASALSFAAHEPVIGAGFLVAGVVAETAALAFADQYAETTSQAMPLQSPPTEGLG